MYGTPIRTKARTGILLYLALIAAFALPGALIAVFAKSSDTPVETRYAVCTTLGTEYVPQNQIGSELDTGDAYHYGPCRPSNEPSTTTEAVS
jgi:hypothetical protein